MKRATNSLAGCFINFARRADLFEIAARENHDAVGNFHRLLLVVRDENRGDVQVVMQRDEPFAEFLADLGVHRAERFVEQQHAGLGRQRAGDGHALALAAGKLVRVTLFQAFQAEQFQQFRDARLDVGPLPFLDLQAEGDVLEHVHVL